MNSVFIVVPILIVLMFLLGTELNKSAFTDVVKNPRAVFVGMFGQIVLLPLIAFVIAYAMGLSLYILWAWCLLLVVRAVVLRMSFLCLSREMWHSR